MSGRALLMMLAPALIFPSRCFPPAALTAIQLQPARQPSFLPPPRSRSTASARLRRLAFRDVPALRDPHVHRRVGEANLDIRSSTRPASTGPVGRRRRPAGMKFAVLTARHHDGFACGPARPATSMSGTSPTRPRHRREYMEAFRTRGHPARPVLLDLGHHRGGPRRARHAREDGVRQGAAHRVADRLRAHPPADHRRVGMAVGPPAVAWEEIRGQMKSLQPDCLLTDTGTWPAVGPGHGQLRGAARRVHARRQRLRGAQGQTMNAPSETGSGRPTSPA